MGAFGERDVRCTPLHLMLDTVDVDERPREETVEPAATGAGSTSSKSFVDFEQDLRRHARHRSTTRAVHMLRALIPALSRPRARSVLHRLDDRGLDPPPRAPPPAGDRRLRGGHGPAAYPPARGSRVRPRTRRRAGVTLAGPAPRAGPPALLPLRAGALPLRERHGAPGRLPPGRSGESRLAGRAGTRGSPRNAERPGLRPAGRRSGPGRRPRRRAAGRAASVGPGARCR